MRFHVFSILATTFLLLVSFPLNVISTIERKENEEEIDVSRSLVAVNQPWPGGPDYDTNPDTFTDNFSGIKYVAGVLPRGDRIWGADNDSVIWKLQPSSYFHKPIVNPLGLRGGGPASWEADPLWGPAGRRINGGYDSEGITFGSGTPANVAYFSSERRNGISENVIVQFSTLDPAIPGSALDVMNVWDLTASLPIVDDNAGIEALTFISDNFLVSRNFKKSDGSLYVPADFPLKEEAGIFFVGLEDNGWVYAFVLNTDLTHTLITSFSSTESSIMDLDFDPTFGYLWTLCDDHCDGRSHVFTLVDGIFTEKKNYSPPTLPADMSTFNLEGFTVQPNSRCGMSGIPNFKLVYWANDDGGFLYSAPIRCSYGLILITCPFVKNAKFLLKNKMRGGKVVPVMQTCGWLRQQSDAMKSSICSKFGDPGVPMANTQCRSICNTCESNSISNSFSSGGY